MTATYRPAQPGRKHSVCAECGEGEGWHIRNPEGELRCDRCSNRGCDFNATALAPIGGSHLPLCARHEAEWVERYGPAELVRASTGYFT